MEVIYPRNTIADSQSAGTIGDNGGTVINEGNLNQTFNDWLTQYFTEDRRKTIIETINNYAAVMPDTGVNELIIAFMARFEDLLNQLINTNNQNTDKIIEKLTELHTVRDLGEFVWNNGNTTQHIYILEGGVPPTITINQYINNICGVAIFGAQFTSNDAATGLVPISLYPVEYIEQLIANNPVITIGADNYVPITICELTINDNELGDQLTDDTTTEDNTTENEVENPYGYLYNWWVLNHVSKISSSDEWRPLDKYGDLNPLNVYLNAQDGEKLMSVGIDYWNAGIGIDEFGLGLKGAGRRRPDGTFENLKDFVFIWSDYEASADNGYADNINGDSGAIMSGNFDKNYGGSLILCKDAPGVANGETTEYVGNDGKIYTAVCINEIYITPQLRELKYRDGSLVTNVKDNAAWAALGTEAFCTYDNEAYLETTNGGITVVDGDDMSLFEIDPDNGLNAPKKVSELNAPLLSSLLLRKI